MMPVNPDKKHLLHQYILMKLEECDYHAVSDAANDLRELVAVANAEIPNITPVKQCECSKGPCQYECRHCGGRVNDKN